MDDRAGGGKEWQERLESGCRGEREGWREGGGQGGERKEGWQEEGTEALRVEEKREGSRARKKGGGKVKRRSDDVTRRGGEMAGKWDGRARRKGINR